MRLSSRFGAVNLVRRDRPLKALGPRTVMMMAMCSSVRRFVSTTHMKIQGN